MSRLPLALLLLAGCAHYTPRPLDLAVGPADYAGRRLDDSALTAALTEAGVPDAWNAYRLAEAAWWLRAERTRSAAEVRVAEAALRTAGAHPDPGASLDLERSFSGRDGSSPWAIAAGPSLTFELGGKRQARQERARSGVVAALATRAVEARSVRGQVHAAALSLLLARRAQQRAELRAALTDTLLSAVRNRFGDGAMSRLEVVRMERERQEAENELLHLRRELQLAEAALATALGVPPAALTAFPLDLTGSPDCRTAPGIDSLRAKALTRRPELGLVLADYLAAEADVRLAVAASWPDLVLGPGLLYDHGVGKWTIGFGLPALALNRHRGPIAEAEARRVVAGARVAELQESLLREVDAAVAACQATEGELAATAALLAAATARETVSRDAYGRGEIGALEVTQARLLTLGSVEERDAGVGRVMQAALMLEAATGDWQPPSAEGAP
ncbi:MAG: TolC family protein [Gemmatimonadota bacterium]|nr:TolC family protein [Gemmatimonadota bacterium]